MFRPAPMRKSMHCRADETTLSGVDGSRFFCFRAKQTERRWLGVHRSWIIRRLVSDVTSIVIASINTISKISR